MHMGQRTMYQDQQCEEQLRPHGTRTREIFVCVSRVVPFPPTYWCLKLIYSKHQELRGTLGPKFWFYGTNFSAMQYCTLWDHIWKGWYMVISRRSIFVSSIESKMTHRCAQAKVFLHPGLCWNVLSRTTCEVNLCSSKSIGLSFFCKNAGSHLDQVCSHTKDNGVSNPRGDEGGGNKYVQKQGNETK